MSGLFKSLRGMDAFGKTMEDVKVKTRTGAFLTVLSAAIILAFTTVEFFDYRTIHMDSSIVVDKSRGEKVSIKFNMTFPHIPCYLLSLDVTDISGERVSDIGHNFLKTRVENTGKVIKNQRGASLQGEVDKAHVGKNATECGSCYGGKPPESGCCQTCDEVRQAYTDRGWSFTNPDNIEQCQEEGWTEQLKEQSGEGCRVSGRVRVNKVTGKLQFSPGKAFHASGRNMNDLLPYLQEEDHKHDWSHEIHEFTFMGDEALSRKQLRLVKTMKERLGIEGDPLDGASGKAPKSQYMFQYFLKVVSTRMLTIDGRKVNTHQFSATQFERDITEDPQQALQMQHSIGGSPGVFFNYEVSPILVVHSETRQSFAHFLTSMCAIVGGVLTIASIIDSLLFQTGRALKKGKFTVPGKGM